MGGIMGLIDLINLIGDIGEAIEGLGAFFSIAGVLLVIVSYFVKGYAIMCTGHKAKVTGDFMPFVPIARQLYQMKITELPVWYIFFFEFTTITVGLVSLISVLLTMLLKLPILVMILLIIYFIANRVFTFLYYQKLYSSFGFNPKAAWLNIIPSLGFISTTFTFLIAFSNAILHKEYVNPVDVPAPPQKNSSQANTGIIAGVVGKYSGANFDMVDGAELTFGRDPQTSNIVFDQTSTDISRSHCSIRFDGRANQYVVTDCSSTGTFLENGVRLEKNQPKTLSRGTTIYLGSSKQNGFRLN